MPTVRITESRGRIPTTTGQPRTTAEDFGAAEGRALEGLGQTTQAIGLEQLAQETRTREADFLNKSTIQATERLAAIEAEEKELGVTGFADRMSARADELFSELGEAAPTRESKRAIQNVLTQKKLHLTANARAFEKRETAAQYIGNYEDSIARLENLLIRDPGKMAEAIADHEVLLSGASGLLDPSDIAKIRDKASTDLTIAYTQGMLQKDPQSVLSAVEAGEYDDLDSRQVEAIKKSAETEIERQQRELQRIQTEAHAAYVEDMKRKASSGAINEMEIVGELEKGNLTVNEASSLQKEMETIEVEAKKVSEDVAFVEEARQNKVPLDTSDTKIKNRLDKYYDTIIGPSITDLQDPDSQATIMSFIGEHGYVPDTVRNSLLGGLNNGDTKQKVTSAQMIDSLMKARPGISKSLGTGAKTTIARASKITANIAAGMSPDEAIKASEILYLEPHTKEFKDRQKNWKNESKDFDYDAFVGRTGVMGWIGGALTDDPNNIPEGMQEEFKTLYEDFAVTFNQDDDLARENAYKILRQNWYPSEISGEPELMKNAPEIHYVGDGSNWHRTQLISDITPIVPKGTDVDTVHLTVNPASANTATPNYYVFTRDEVGEPIPVLDEAGKPRLWQPSWEEAQRAKAKEIEEDKVRKAQKELKKGATASERGEIISLEELEANR